jgi:hypothetical protein
MAKTEHTLYFVIAQIDGKKGYIEEQYDVKAVQYYPDEYEIMGNITVCKCACQMIGGASIVRAGKLDQVQEYFNNEKQMQMYVFTKDKSKKDTLPKMLKARMLQELYRRKANAEDMIRMIGFDLNTIS